MIPPTRCVYELGSSRRPEVGRLQTYGRVLRDILDVDHAEARRTIAPKQPRLAVDIDSDEVAASARRVKRRDFDVEQRAEDVGFEEVGVSVQRISVTIQFRRRNGMLLGQYFVML